MHKDTNGMHNTNPYQLNLPYWSIILVSSSCTIINYCILSVSDSWCSPSSYFKDSCGSRRIYYSSSSSVVCKLNDTSSYLACSLIRFLIHPSSLLHLLLLSRLAALADLLLLLLLSFSLSPSSSSTTFGLLVDFPETIVVIVEGVVIVLSVVVDVPPEAIVVVITVVPDEDGEDSVLLDVVVPDDTVLEVEVIAGLISSPIRSNMVVTIQLKPSSDSSVLLFQSFVVMMFEEVECEHKLQDREI